METMFRRVQAASSRGFATSIDLQTLTFETKMQLSKQARLKLAAIYTTGTVTVSILVLHCCCTQARSVKVGARSRLRKTFRNSSVRLVRKLVGMYVASYSDGNCWRKGRPTKTYQLSRKPRRSCLKMGRSEACLHMCCVLECGCLLAGALARLHVVAGSSRAVTGQQMPSPRDSLLHYMQPCMSCIPGV